MESATEQRPFATISKPADVFNVSRIHLTLGLLDSLVVYKTLTTVGAIVATIQLIFAVASFSKNPLSSATSLKLFLDTNRPTLWTIGFLALGYIYFRLSHLLLLNYDRNLETRGPAGISNVLESERRWFHSWGDGDPDYSDLTTELRKAEKAMELDIISQVNAQLELFSSPGSGSGKDLNLISTQRTTHNPTPKTIILRTPIASYDSLNSRLSEKEDSQSKEPIWCVADAGGTMVAKRAQLAQQRQLVQTESTSPSTLQQRLQSSLIGMSSQGIEIVDASKLRQSDLHAMGLIGLNE
ncbi:hypothetical protein BCR33DRAFT_718895 [Rhizoclosmatium globosum]|uniref:Uncharacterized protein n=1 Tax=Rhizoclosmatium globosum TaxID=329046 RepID=A0A1Y2C2J0_9FUNG|nr:hypothetical protein BCR33DRAFT_718895 [Rhizoclosmatium globosum]|eukprot:ORY41239.1 hypothetical protein BCR33DRAFT_718895 [Rhizoclosmatium globosum]